MRSTPGRPYPLIIPLSTGPKKTHFLKIMFSHKYFITFPQKWCFSTYARGLAAPTAASVLGIPRGTQNPLKNDMEKGCEKCAKKNFELEIWCSWLRFRRPGARPGRPKSVPRAAQDGPKSCARLIPARFATFWGALGHFFAFSCGFVRILDNFSLNFGELFVNF